MSEKPKSDIINHPGISIDINDALRKRFEEQSESENFEEWVSDNVGPDSACTFTLEFEENDNGEVCIKIPDELIILLGWELDDDIIFEETDHDGGFTLQNLSKQFREGLEHNP